MLGSANRRRNRGFGWAGRSKNRGQTERFPPPLFARADWREKHSKPPEFDFPGVEIAHRAASTNDMRINPE
jgi:hypothetical protein